ncbi:hypothetical protein KAU11_08945 [Candidatus Babeliales bacterium]|nr:hypothetical protein [Candidatus Babeliales bacterium]
MIHLIEWLKEQQRVAEAIECWTPEDNEYKRGKLDAIKKHLHYLQNPRVLTLEVIKKTVENIFGLKDIAVKSKKGLYSDARKVFVKIAFTECNKNETEITKKIKRHRTSFYHSVREASYLVEHNKDFREKYLATLKDLMLC